MAALGILIKWHQLILSNPAGVRFFITKEPKQQESENIHN